MAKTNPKKSSRLPLRERISLVKRHPCFSQFAQDELEKLALLLSEKIFESGDKIVVENELVNSIYFIAKGKTEVTHQHIPMATLGAGEVIGLSESGLFSTSGSRTATVTAITETTTLRLDIQAFDELARHNIHLDALINKQIGTFQRMNLIKHATPFSTLSIEDLNWLSEQTAELSIAIGNILFKKGDPGENCYLIQSGKIEIFTPNPDGTENRLAVLKPNSIFGEISLFLNTPRTASARALSDCKLLTLNREALISATQKSRDVSNALMTMTKARSCPRKFSHIECFPYESSDEESIATLKDKVNGTYFRLTQEGLFLWQLLDGTRTIRDLSIEYYNEYDIYDPAMISNFIMDLIEDGFIEANPAILDENKDQPYWIRFSLGLRRVMEACYSFKHADKWVTRHYEHWGYLFFKPLAHICFISIILSGLIAFVLSFHHHVELLGSTPHAGWILIATTVIGMASAVFHELSHAFTTKYYGREVKNFGIGWFWLGPIAFCDTSDMWLNPKMQRVHVDLAGMYTDIILAGISSLCALIVTNPYLELFFWLFTLFSYIGVMRNLNPTIELDGCYALGDYLGKDNLRLDAVTWMVDNFSNIIKKPSLLFQRKIEVSYWWICIAYLIFDITVSYYLAVYLLNGLLGINNPYINLGLLITVIVLSSFSLIADARKVRH